MSQKSDPRGIERIAFDEIGQRDLGLRIWHESREAAEQAWRDCRARLRAKYGARSPHDGWSMFVLFGALLCGAVGAVLTSGFRFDPRETATAVTVLTGIAAIADLVVLFAVGWRPVNWAAVRLQIGLAIALGLAAAFQLSRVPAEGTSLVAGAAAVGVAGLALMFIVRALRPAEREEIDNAINVAVAEMRPEVDATAARIQADTLAELSPEEQARIVGLRAGWLGDQSADGVPPGGVIIASFLTDWNSYLKKERG